MLQIICVMRPDIFEKLNWIYWKYLMFAEREIEINEELMIEALSFGIRVIP